MSLHIDVLRLHPGDDLRHALAQVLAAPAPHGGIDAACVISVVGSLTRAVLRYAAEHQGSVVDGPLELISLSGTLSRDGVHPHASVSDAAGRMYGGHVMPGCTVRTTAEVVIGLLPGWRFSRVPDSSTGFLELLAERRPPG